MVQEVPLFMLLNNISILNNLRKYKMKNRIDLAFLMTMITMVGFAQTKNNDYEKITIVLVV